MTEPMIPLSVIDAKIAELKPFEYENRIPYLLIRELEEIKKEAIPFPIFSIMEPSLEQKIKDRINGWDASLHDPNRFKYYKKGEWKPHKERVLFLIDELRKLLK